ncbi:CCHC-type domain-containing protein [Abeliophyllum distichum]|uniref:CCHC-type domain-containing protein n=1 Tax=Abeliophyllum distichum TaxID=126358 RepID=A0ABD1RVD5_9LAMI
MSSRLPPIRVISDLLCFVPRAVLPKRPTYRSNSDETNELQIHQIKANKGYRFIFKPGHWFWMHVKDVYPFDAGNDSRSNPFEEGGNDAIQDQNEGKTKLEDKNANGAKICARGQKK